MNGIYRADSSDINGTLRFYEEEGYTYAETDLIFDGGRHLQAVFFLDEDFGSVPPDENEDLEEQEGTFVQALTTVEFPVETDVEDDGGDTAGLTPGDPVFIVSEIGDEKIVIRPTAGFYADIEEAGENLQQSFTLYRAENE